MNSKLTRRFFNRSTLTVAKELLGKTLVFNNCRGIITETEAYIGEDDPACHAARGRTARTEVMYQQPGISYVYLIYGMYYCLNIVTEKQDFPAAVLIRGLIITAEKNRRSYINLNGPGKLCKYLGITTQHNKIDLINSKDFYVLSPEIRVRFCYTTTPRIGIKLGTDKLWRFKITELLVNNKIIDL